MIPVLMPGPPSRAARLVATTWVALKTLFVVSWCMSAARNARATATHTTASQHAKTGQAPQVECC